MPLYMEFMEKETAKIGYEIKGMNPPEGTVIFFVTTGISRREAEEKLDLVIQSLNKESPLEIRAISDMEEWEKLWSAREVIGSYIMQKNESQFSSAEIVSNLKDLPACMEDARTFNQGLPLLGQLRLYLFGHIGSLTMHPGVLIPKDWDDAKFKQAIVEKFNRETQLNVKYGTCGGEWGQFAHRADFFRKRYGEIGYNLVKQFKAVVDEAVIIQNLTNLGIESVDLDPQFIITETLPEMSITIQGGQLALEELRPRDFHFFIDCSPITQRKASAIFDLPLPLGPTIAVIPGSKTSLVLSAKRLTTTDPTASPIKKSESIAEKE
jgi:hypothetical protein